MILVLKELSTNRKSFIIWTLVNVAMIIFSLSMFPTFASESDQVNQLMKSLPESMMKAFNISTLNFGNPMEYLSYIFQYILLFVGIWYMVLGATLISKEESEKTIEFLLAKPVTRNYIVKNKMISAGIQIIIFNILFFFIMLISLLIFANSKEISINTLFLMSLSLVCICLIYVSIGFIISVFITRTRQVMPVSLGVVLGTYFFSVFSSMSDKLSWLKNFTPFKYFDPLYIVKNSRFEFKYLIITIIISIICIVATFIFYNKKDISV